MITGVERAHDVFLRNCLLPLAPVAPQQFKILLGRSLSILPVPEKRMVLHTHFPEALGSAVVWQFEPDGAFKLFKLKN